MARRRRGGRASRGSTIAYATKIDGVPFRIPASAFSSAILGGTALQVANLTTVMPDWVGTFKITSIFVAGEVDGGDYTVSIGNSGTSYAVSNNLKTVKIPMPKEDHSGWWTPGTNDTSNVCHATTTDSNGAPVYQPIGKFLKSVQVLVTDYFSA